MSCKFIAGESSAMNTCENKLKSELQTKWKYDSEKKRYFGDLKFLSQLDSSYHECLIGKDTSYISKLFGQHYSIRSSGKSYRMDFPMIPCDDMKCGSFFFQLNQDYKVEKNYFLLIDRGSPMQEK